MQALQELNVSLQEVEIPGFELTEIEKLRMLTTELKKEVANLRRGIFARYDVHMKEIDRLSIEIERMKASPREPETSKIVYV